jgi:septin family protein
LPPIIFCGKSGTGKTMLVKSIPATLKCTQSISKFHGDDHKTRIVVADNIEEFTQHKTLFADNILGKRNAIWGLVSTNCQAISDDEVLTVECIEVITEYVSVCENTVLEYISHTLKTYKDNIYSLFKKYNKDAKHNFWFSLKLYCQAVVATRIYNVSLGNVGDTEVNRTE